MTRKGAGVDKKKFFKAYFVVVGVYDILLGLAFALFFRAIYASIGVAPPNHPGYILVPALFLVSGGVGEFLIARNLMRNIDLVVVRTLMKLTFASVIFYCHMAYGIPKIYLAISVLSVFGVVKNIFFMRWVLVQQKGG